ncbi:MAG: hypothetical protein ABWZ98_14500 [Nakamurella sp.]
MTSSETPVTTSAPASARAARSLSVFADLRMESDGQRVHLVGDGTSLVVHSSDPLRLWSALTSSALPSGVGRVNGPRAAGRAANALRDAGLRVDLTGPNGVLVALGNGAGTAAGRALTGSNSVGFGSLRAVLSTVPAVTPRVKIAAGLAAATALAAFVWRRTR